MISDKYVLMIQEGEKVYGRMLDEHGGSNGFVVFPHRDIFNPGPGLFRITDLKLIYTDKEANTKFGFVDGHYVIPDNINTNSLSLEQKHSLVSRGIIKYKGSFGNDDFIAMKSEIPGENIYYLAFMINGKFEFINKLKYLNEYTLFNNSLNKLNAKVASELFITKNRMLSFKGMCRRPIGDSKILLDNKDKYVLRQLFNDRRYKELHVALYLCEPHEEFNLEVYEAIKEYNNKVADTVMSEMHNIDSDEHDVDKIYSILRFYNLNTCI